MKLIIVRHGKAESDSAMGRDEDRQLRGRGRRQAQWLGERFAEGVLRPRLILVSRYARAMATAEMIGGAVGCPLEVAAGLESGRRPSDAVELIGAHSAADPLMVVGHNPQLSELIWLLTRGMPAEEAGLRTGEAVILEVDPADPIGTAHELERVRMDEGD